MKMLIFAFVAFEFSQSTFAYTANIECKSLEERKRFSFRESSVSYGGILPLETDGENIIVVAGFPVHVKRSKSPNGVEELSLKLLSNKRLRLGPIPPFNTQPIKEALGYLDSGVTLQASVDIGDMVTNSLVTISCIRIPSR